MKRLNTEKSLAPLVTQFVPLKVDTATPEYIALQRKHRSEGNTIPKIFVIRADGKKLYAKSGSLSGDQLPLLMAEAVREMGRPMEPSEISVLAKINSEIESALKSENLKSAATLFKKVTKLGPFGDIKSFAKVATQNNLLAQQMNQTVVDRVNDYTAALSSKESRFETVIKALKLKSEVGTMPTFRIATNSLEKKVRAALEDPKMFSEIKTVASSIGKLNHSSETVRERAKTALKGFLESTNDPSAKDYVGKLLGDSNSTSTAKPTPAPKNSTPAKPELRTWTSNDGKFKIEAAFVEFDGVNVSLKKANGDVLSVPVNRLSSEDIKFAKSQK